MLCFAVDTFFLQGCDSIRAVQHNRLFMPYVNMFTRRVRRQSQSVGVWRFEALTPTLEVFEVKHKTTGATGSF